MDDDPPETPEEKQARREGRVGYDLTGIHRQIVRPGDDQRRTPFFGPMIVLVGAFERFATRVGPIKTIILVALCVAGVWGWRSAATAPDPAVAEMRSELKDLRSDVDAQRAVIGDLKTDLAVLTVRVTTQPPAPPVTAPKPVRRRK